MSKPPVTGRGLAAQLDDGTSIVAAPPDLPRYPHGGDPVRRARLRQVLVRRRAGRALDAMLTPPPCCRCHAELDEVEVQGDPYADAHLDRTWAERDLIGRELASARWSP